MQKKLELQQKLELKKYENQMEKVMISPVVAFGALSSLLQS
jgi:hypothetical protein